METTSNTPINARVTNRIGLDLLLPVPGLLSDLSVIPAPRPIEKKF
jgi:hypothetical protein